MTEDAPPPPRRPDWPVTLLLLSFPFVFGVGGLILVLSHDEPRGWIGVAAFLLAVVALIAGRLRRA